MNNKDFPPDFEENLRKFPYKMIAPLASTSRRYYECLTIPEIERLDKENRELYDIIEDYMSFYNHRIDYSKIIVPDSSYKGDPEDILNHPEDYIGLKSYTKNKRHGNTDYYLTILLNYIDNGRHPRTRFNMVEALEKIRKLIENIEDRDNKERYLRIFKVIEDVD